MEQIALADAKDTLKDLVARAVKGEEIVITDATLGTVRLTPVAGTATSGNQPKRKLKLGLLEGVHKVPEGLFDPLPDDELKRWWGEGE